jgi:hypothetical protein
MAASPSTRVCGRLRIIRPNIDVVLRFAVRAVSVQRAQNALAGKELGKGVGQIEYHCKRDQVRRCCNYYHSNADISFRSLVQGFPDATLGISVVVDDHIFQADVYSVSHAPTQSRRPRKLSRWGDRAVVVIIGI